MSKRFVSAYLALALFVTVFMVKPTVSNAIVDEGYSYAIASANAKIVGAESEKKYSLAAISTTASDGESFKIINNADGTISFQTKTDERYVSVVHAAGSYQLAPKSKKIKESEKFKMAAQEDGTVAIQAMENNLYVSVDLEHGAVLTATSKTVGTSEKFTIVTCGRALATPAALTVNASRTTSAELNWSAVNNAKGYNVYRSNSSTGTYSKINTADVTAMTFTDTGLTPNTRYYYKVSSVSLCGESNLSESVSALTLPDFGPNVYIFDPSTPAVDIQNTATSVFNTQEKNEFGNERYALLFKPGAYNANIRVGFYTQVAGLGTMPDDVTINGGLTVDANWMPSHNATKNFWRAAENLAVAPSSGDNKWAVAQAAPLRRMHIKGNLSLHDQGGWASGGFLADSIVDGKVTPASQQQWLSRNSQWANWTNGVWNMVFVGSVNPPAGTWPKSPYTVVEKTPVIREKPFLTVNASGQYNVFVPAVQNDTQGISWANGGAPGEAITIEQFYIARPDTSDAASINAALSQGKHLLFTPGIYHLNDTIRVTNPNTVVLGLGLATLMPENGAAAMSVADVDGVKVAGLLFDAGSVSSPVLLEVGPAGSSKDHSSNPTSLHDLFFRVGGAAVGKADVSLKINSNHVIGDHFWIWRADHGSGVAWDSNTTTNGLIVNGNDVTIYGLFVEHYHQYQTLWNGNGGRTYFYQSEIPYDVPSQSSWMNGDVNGYASYKVADSVTSHEAWGLGIYSFFRDADVKLNSAIEVPNHPGVKIHHATSVYLSGNGEITHIINDTGNAAKKGSMRQTITEYPE